MANQKLSGYPKSNRLLNAADFKAVFQSRRKLRNPFFSCYLLKQNSQRVRLGVVVKKKYFPKAVTRNKLKRFIRESFRQHRFQNLSVDVVVMAEKQCEQLNNQQLLEQLNGLWQQLMAFLAKS